MVDSAKSRLVRNCALLWRKCAALLLLLGACAPLIPATTPPQLQHTPGAFVSITATRFDAGLYRLDYPSAWRVVKSSTADTPLLQIVFVAPDQSSVTLTQIANIASAEHEGVLTLDNGIVLAVHIQTAQDDALGFASQAEQLIASIRS